MLKIFLLRVISCSVLFLSVLSLPLIANSYDASNKVANASYVKMYNQMQYLQEEFFRMQGKVEKLENELKLLKQQQLKDYINIDKRLQALPQKSLQVTPQSNQPTKPPAQPIVADLYVEYKKAYALVKDKKFTAAKKAFNEFITQHSKDPLAGNAYYWLGELYIIDKDFKQAKYCFNKIIKDYPSHNKVPEAIYKLGRIAYDQGDKKLAKKKMQQILEQYKGKKINAIKLAENFLKNNF